MSIETSHHHTQNSRMTRQRAVILEELQKVRTHPTADEIFTMVKKIMPRISLGTVYRNLDYLVEAGTIRKIDSAGTIRRFDADMSHHDHARCVNCGRLADVFYPSSSTPSIQDIRLENFTITSAHIEYEGLCHCCQQNMTA